MNERIRKIRLQNNLNQTDFAKRISVSRSAVCKMESGENSPSEQTISLICKEFNVNEDWLRTGLGETYIEVSNDMQIESMFKNIQQSGTNTFKYRLISALAKLDESDWEILKKLADAISSK